jgi:hypothetical protein
MTTTEVTISAEEKEAARKAKRAQAERERRARKKAEANGASQPTEEDRVRAALKTAGLSEGSDLSAEQRARALDHPELASASLREFIIHGKGGSQVSRAEKDPEAMRLVERAKEIAPEIKSPYAPHEARSLITIVGRRDPIAFAFLEAPGEVEPEAQRGVLEDWTHARLEKADPRAVLLRARARTVSKHPEAKNLWGRKIGALLLALADLRTGR